MKWDDVITGAIISVGSTVIGLIVLLVRKIFTNETEITLLKNQLESFDEGMKELKSDVKNILFHLSDK